MNSTDSLPILNISADCLSKNVLKLVLTCFFLVFFLQN